MLRDELQVSGLLDVVRPDLPRPSYAKPENAAIRQAAVRLTIMRRLEDLFERSEEMGMKWPEEYRKSMLLWKVRSSRPEAQMLDRMSADGVSYRQLRGFLLEDEAAERELKEATASTAEAGAFLTSAKGSSNLKRKKPKNQKSDEGKDEERQIADEVRDKFA